MTTLHAARRSFAVLGAVLMVLPVVSGSFAAVAAEPTALIIKFTADGAELGAERSLFGGHVQRVDASLGFAVVVTLDPDGVRARALADDRVAYVHEDEEAFHVTFTPNDPKFNEQYGPQNTRAPLAWDITLGSTAVRICIVDTGTRYTHEDLAGPRYLGGYDYVNNDADPMDDHGHGTHVAGIAAAGIDNGIGIAGAANAAYFAVKVLNAEGSGTYGQVASGITWCADNGAHIISMSLGGSSPGAVVEDALAHANAAGALVIAAAGNRGQNEGYNTIGYPARYDGAMAVTCTDHNDVVCSFSSAGPQAEIAAPGFNIVAPYHQDDAAYATFSGTSMSTPLVSGIAALAWSLVPGYTGARVREALQQSARDLGSAGHDNLYGHGLVDARGIMDLLAPLPPLERWWTIDFDAGTAPGFTLGGLWHVDDACFAAASAPNYLGYHRANDCDYDELGGSRGAATLDVDLTDAIAATLTFDHRFTTETNADEVVDVMRIAASDDGGTTWRDLAGWDSRDANILTWTPVDLNLNRYAGSTVKVRFSFDTVDPLDNDHAGWFLDDVTLLAVDNYLPVAVAGANATVTDGDSDGVVAVALDGTASFDRDGSLVAYEWRHDGAVIATTATATQPLPLGTHPVTLTVTDNDGASATATRVVTVAPNLAPVARAGADVTVGDTNGDGVATVALDGSGSTDADGSVVAYAWTDGTTTLGTGAAPAVVLPVGSHDVTLTVTDNGGGTATDTVTVTVVPNVPPVARFVQSCYSFTCSFDAAASTDADGTLVAFAWDFGDGATASGATASHSFPNAGPFDVALTVTDDGGATGSVVRRAMGAGATGVLEDFDDLVADDFTLTGLWHANNHCVAPTTPPASLAFTHNDYCQYNLGWSIPRGTATVTWPLQAATHAELRFNHWWQTELNRADRDLMTATVTRVSDGLTWKQTWTPADGRPSAWQEVVVDLADFVAVTDDTLEIKFRFDGVDSLSNGYKGWFIDDLLLRTADSVFPTAVAGGDVVVHDTDGTGAETVRLDGTGSFDADGTIAVYEWSRAGATVATGPTADLALAVGTHTLTLTVTDDAGATDTDRVHVTVVANAAPFAHAGADFIIGDPDGNGLAPATFDGSGSADSDGVIASYVWSNGAGHLASGKRPTLDLPVGVHTFTLTVTDDGGATATDLVTVTVRANEAPWSAFGFSCLGTTCRMDASCSADEDGDVTRWSWTFSDGTTASGLVPEHTFPAAGPFDVTLRVEDDGGAVTEVTRRVAVQATSPYGAPSRAPSDPDIRDNRPDLMGDRLPVLYLDAESAWFSFDANTVYVGMKVNDIPPLGSGAFARYAVQFVPDYAVADTSWDGALTASQSLLALRVIASQSPVGIGSRGGLTPDVRFALYGLVAGSSSTTSEVLIGDVVGSMSQTSDIVWWQLPRALLQHPPSTATLAETTMSASPWVSGAPPLAGPVADTAGQGRDVTLPERCEQAPWL